MASITSSLSFSLVDTGATGTASRSISTSMTISGYGEYTDILAGNLTNYSMSFAGMTLPRMIYIQTSQILGIKFNSISNTELLIDTSVLEGSSPVGVFYSTVSGISSVFLSNKSASPANIRVVLAQDNET